MTARQPCGAGCTGRRHHRTGRPGSCAAVPQRRRTVAAGRIATSSPATRRLARRLTCVAGRKGAPGDAGGQARAGQPGAGTGGEPARRPRPEGRPGTGSLTCSWPRPARRRRRAGPADELNLIQANGDYGWPARPAPATRTVSSTGRRLAAGRGGLRRARVPGGRLYLAGTSCTGSGWRAPSRRPSSMAGSAGCGDCYRTRRRPVACDAAGAKDTLIRWSRRRS